MRYWEADGSSAVGLAALGASGALGGLVKSLFFGLVSRSSSFCRPLCSVTVALDSRMPADAADDTEPGSAAYRAWVPADAWVVRMKEPRKPSTTRASGDCSCTTCARVEAPWIAPAN